MKINYEKYFFLFLITVLIILLFTLGDYFMHQLSAEYEVPPRYFPHKVIYGTVIGFIALLFTQKLNIWLRALIFSSAVSILLQIRYLIEGYPLDFVILFLFIHLAILFVVSAIIFKILEKKKII